MTKRLEDLVQDLDNKIFRMKFYNDSVSLQDMIDTRDEADCLADIARDLEDYQSRYDDCRDELIEAKDDCRALEQRADGLQRSNDLLQEKIKLLEEQVSLLRTNHKPAIKMHDALAKARLRVIK